MGAVASPKITEDVVEKCDYDNRAEGLGRVGNWMQTRQGIRFWPLDPRPEEVFIEDIASALSKLCRFTGHCTRFYSVAEHSVHVSRCVPQELALYGLLHDASEAYVGDVGRPLKRFLEGYDAIEHGVWVAVATRFGLPIEHPPEIKVADNAVLLAEQQTLMVPCEFDWCIPGERAQVSINGWSPQAAEEAFLARFYELYL